MIFGRIGMFFPMGPGPIEIPVNYSFDDWNFGMTHRSGSRALFGREDVLSIWRDEFDQTRDDEVLKKAKNGANFDELVKTYSEDAGSVGKTPPGSYALMQDGKPKPTPDARSWSEWVPAFSALSFALDVEEIAMTVPDAELSPFGFHIIKRIK